MISKGMTLRPIEEEDLSYLRDLGNDPVVRLQVGGWDWPLSLAGQRAWFTEGADTNTTRRFLIEVEGRGRVGLIGLWDIDWHNRTASTGLKIGVGEGVRHSGFGSQALRMMMDFAFCDVGLNRLWATILATNEASLGLFVRACGWTVEGLSRSHVFRAGKFCDLVQLGILREEYVEWSQAHMASEGQI